MRCKKLARLPVIVCRPNDSVAHCAELMRSERVGLLPVVDLVGRPVGVVTDRDLVERVLAANVPTDTPIGVHMSKEVIACSAEDQIGVAEALMKRHKKSRIILLDEDGECAGVLSLSDITRAEPARRAGKLLRSITKREAGLPSSTESITSA
jgi:CBS domain-containing protein